MINEGFLVIILFIILALLRVPVFISLIIPSLLYLLVFAGQPPQFIINRMVRIVDSFTLLAVPIFIYVGALMNHGEVTNKIFDVADNFVGHLTGGMAQVNILTSLIFSGISGSALADIGGVGKVLIHTMKDFGYNKNFSAALTSVSATVGPLFPPSIPLIIYGVLANESILELLIAGAIPAIVVVILLMLGTYIIARYRKYPSNEIRPPTREIIRSVVVALPAIATPIVLIIGMLSGLFGPTEAAAVTVLYILLINTTVYRVTDYRYMWDAAVETAKTTSVILIILAAAGLFSFILSIERVPHEFESILLSISHEPAIVLLIVIIIVLVIGLVLDPLAGLVMITPVVVPPLLEVGYNGVHIGVVVVYGLMIGLLTPPLGLSIYLSADIAEADPVGVFKSCFPYYIILLVGLFVIAFIPEFSLYLLNFT